MADPVQQLLKTVESLSKRVRALETKSYHIADFEIDTLGTAYQSLQTNVTLDAVEWGASAKSILTNTGDILYASGANTPARLAKGTAHQGLYMNSGATVPEWGASARSTLTTTGDILYASAANVLARLGVGSVGDVLTLAGGVPTWAAPSGGIEMYFAYMQRGSDQSISSGGSPTTIDFTSELADTHGSIVDLSGNQLTAPAAGIMLVSGYVQWESTDMTESVTYMYIDGSAYHKMQSRDGTPNRYHTVIDLVGVTSGTDIKIAVYQNSGGASKNVDLADMWCIFIPS